MKAIRRSRYGSPDVLELRDVPTPVPGDGEVLVRHPRRVRQPRRPGLPHRHAVHHADGDGPARAEARRPGPGRGGHRGGGRRGRDPVRAGRPRLRQPDHVWLRRLRGVRVRAGAGVGTDAGRRHLRAGCGAAGSLDHRLPGSGRRPLDQARRQRAHQRGVGQRRPVRGAAREVVRGRGYGRLQHAEDGLRAVARGRQRHRLHQGRLHANGPALRLSSMSGRADPSSRLGTPSSRAAAT